MTTKERPMGSPFAICLAAGIAIVCTLGACSAPGPVDASHDGNDATLDSQTNDVPVEIAADTGNDTIDVAADSGIMDSISDDGVGDTGGDAAAPDSEVDSGPPDCGCAAEANASVSCVRSVCESTCEPGFSRCGGTCVPESATQCGAGCESCFAGRGGATPQCSNGRCSIACPAGSYPCPGALSSDCCDFAVERVAPDNVGWGGASVTVATGPDASTHLSYINYNDAGLMYARRVGAGPWQVERVGYMSGSGGSEQHLAISSAGEAWLLFTDSLLLGFHFARRSPTGWIREYVDESYAPLTHAIAADTFGHAHICFGGNGGGLRYGVRRGDRWFFRDVDASVGVGTMCSIAVDAEGTAHIAYYLPASGDLAYAVGTDAGFTTSTVDSTGDVGRELAIEIGPSGEPRIAYYDATATAMKYASARSGSWTLSTVATGIGSRPRPTLAFDSSGAAVIAYWDDRYAIRIAREASPTWTTGPISTTVIPGEAAIAALPGGQLVAGVVDGPGVYAADAVGAGWSIAPVDLETSSPSARSIAMLGAQPVTAFVAVPPGSGMGATTGVVTVAERTGPESWSQSPVSGETGDSPSIAVDSAGVEHVAWHATTGDDLRYATRSGGGTWATQTVESSGITGIAPAIALDSVGHPRIVYVGPNGAATALKIAEWDGATWNISIVASPVTTNAGARIVLGPGDVPHVVFYDGTARDMMYATRSSTGWGVSTIEATSDAGGFHAITLDPFGNPTVCYSRLTSGFYTLRYALFFDGTWTPNSVVVSGAAPSGPCAAAFDGSGRLNIAYSDSIAGLRLATFDGTNWSSLRIDYSGAGTIALAYDATSRPLIVYSGRQSRSVISSTTFATR